MQTDVRVDFIGFNRAMVELQRATGQGMKQVIRSEVGHILKGAAAKTKVGNQASVDPKSRLRSVKKLGLTQAPSVGDVTVNSGRRKSAPYGRVWIKFRSGAGRKGFLLAKGAGFTDPTGSAALRITAKSGAGTDVWLASVRNAASVVKQLVPGFVARGRRSIGLARQSFIQMADALGIDLQAVPGTNLGAGDIAKARAALSSGGQAHQNGTGKEYARAEKYFVELATTLPYGRRAKLDVVLARAINSRATKFGKNLQAGVFADARKVLKKYPGLFVA